MPLDDRAMSCCKCCRAVAVLDSSRAAKNHQCCSVVFTWGILNSLLRRRTHACPSKPIAGHQAAEKPSPRHVNISLPSAAPGSSLACHFVCKCARTTRQTMTVMRSKRISNEKFLNSWRSSRRVAESSSRMRYTSTGEEMENTKKLQAMIAAVIVKT